MKTALSREEAQAILGQYGLVVTELTALADKGTINSNFRVRAGGRVFFLRINEGKTDLQVLAEAQLVDRLAPTLTPALVRTVGGQMFCHHGHKQISLFAWCGGHEADGQRPEVAGEALGRLHHARPQATLGDNAYSIARLGDRLQRIGADARLKDVLPRLAAGLERARKLPPCPSGVIHQDLFPDNVLVDAGGKLAAVLDFEQATYGPYVYDLAVAINAWCFDGARFPRAAALVEAYEAFRPLRPEERSALRAFCHFAAVRFTLTRITDIFLRPDCPPDLARRKDYRDFLRRVDFWEREA